MASGGERVSRGRGYESEPAPRAPVGPELTPEEKARNAADEAASKQEAEEALAAYEQAPTTNVLAEKHRHRLMISQSARLRAADEKAGEAKQAGAAQEAAAAEQRKSENAEKAAQLVANLRAVASERLPPIVEAARQARIAGKLTPSGTEQLLAAIANACTITLVRAAGASDAANVIRAACGRLGRGETVDVLASNFEGAAVMLSRALPEKAAAASGDLLSSVASIDVLAAEIEKAAAAALYQATGQKQGFSDKEPAEKGAAGGREQPSAGPAASGGGMELAPQMRAKMEQSFGQDFSSVKVYADSSRAGGTTHAVTQGDEIHFAPGKYQPESAEGEQLIAHELAHVVQQRRGSAVTQAYDERAGGELLERDADESARDAARGDAARPQMVASAGMHQRFDSYEHKQLGDAGGKNIKLKCGVWLTYGQAVALSGDFYKTPDALMNAPREEVVRLLDLIDREGGEAKANEAKHGGNPEFAKPTSKESAANEEEAQNATAWREETHYGVKHKPDGKEGQVKGKETDSYLTLASHNASHFSDQNAALWRAEHEAALEIARAAHSQGNHSSTAINDEKLNEAYAHDAFACHFLTDAFSSGHLVSGVVGRDVGEHFWRTHESAILKAMVLASRDDEGGIPTELMGVMEKVAKSKAPSLCLKLVHDHLNETGLQVRNAAGNEWTAFGDQNLDRAPESVQLGQQAVRLSRESIDQAAAGESIDESRLSPADLIPSEVGYQGQFLPIKEFVQSQTIFEAFLKEQLLRPTGDNPLYQLIKGNIGIGVLTGEAAAKSVGRDIKEQAAPDDDDGDKGQR